MLTSNASLKRSKKKMDVMFGLMFGLVLLVGGVSAYMQVTCQNPHYVQGMECSGTENFKTCVPAMVYDSCDD